MDSKSFLRLQLLPARQLARQSADFLSRVLGVAAFGLSPCPELAGLGFPLAPVRVQVLDGEADLCEVWTTGAALREGSRGRLRWRASEELLFGALALDVEQSASEAAARGHGSLPAPMQRAAQAAYHELWGALDGLGYPHLLRVWNHVPDINRESAGLEHYRQFNVGRQDAFLAHGRHVEGATVPSASALGAQAGAPLVVYFIAARHAARAVENPRQISAYHYPADYGPRTPTFSRANVACIGGETILFVSGTASIVGHETLHLGNVREQTRETLRNIEAVLRAAGGSSADVLALHDLQFKVYVRHPEDLSAIRAVLHDTVGSEVQALYLQADVCRSNLLVEIEAIGLPVEQESRL